MTDHDSTPTPEIHHDVGSDLVGDPSSAELAALLSVWLPAQRWFAGHDILDSVEVVTRTVALRSDVARFEHLIVRIPASHDLPQRYYQLWLGFTAELPDRLAHAQIGALATDPDATADRIIGVIDALHSPVLTSRMLEALAAGEQLGDVTCRTILPGRIDTTATGLVISGEQSNTSIVYGDSTILKIFRRIDPGPNPDAELCAALSTAGSPHVPPLYAELSGDVEGVPSTLGVLTQFLTNSADGWLTATASVRDLMAEGDLRADEVGGDFAPEARRLGAAVAEVHRDLVAAFGTRQADGDELAALFEAMAGLAAVTSARVPELASRAAAIAAFYDQVRGRTDSLVLQRIHGDLHLGQTLRTLTGWAIIDFEGEPSKPLTYRRDMHPAVQDVAGMIRSFDYAAHHLLAGTVADTQHSYRATEWAQRNVAAFQEGYLSVAGDDGRSSAAMLTVFEMDKAIYEVGYEHDHRPGWVQIPLQAVDRLLRQEGLA